MKSSHGFFFVIFDEDELRSLCADAPTKENMSLVRHFLYSWVSLLYDSPLNDSSLKPARLYRVFKKRLLEDGLLQTIRRYASLADELMQYAYLYGSDDFTNHWVEGFRDTPLFKEYHSFSKTGDPVVARFLLSFCLFGKKLKFENKAWHDVAFRNWLDTEKRLSLLELPVHELPIIKSIVQYLLVNFSFNNVYPKFGPGKVAEKFIRDEIHKANNLRPHRYLTAILRNLHYGDFSEFPVDELFYQPDEEYYPLVSRLKFVPKDITKSRSICMESNSVMFVQQALWEAFRIAFAEGPMSQFVDLSDQSINQRMAQYGSTTGDVDTIDLSSASDSVSFELVKKIFPKEVLFYLALSRSKWVDLPDGRRVKMRKFAPMGSSLCFPIQCVIFTALSIYAAMIHSGWIETHRSSLLEVCLEDRCKAVRSFISHYFCIHPKFIHPSIGKYQPVRVYGDDICVDSSLTNTLTTVLSRFGFVVNGDKSFTASQAFRESCGGYYLAGYDVTPLRYTLKGRESDRDARFFMSCIALTNRAGDRGYFHVRRFLLQSVLFNRGNKIPLLFSDDDDLPFAIKSFRPINDHLVHVYSSDIQPHGCTSKSLQRTELKCITIIFEKSREASPVEVDAHEAYRYMRWWAQQRSDVVRLPVKGSTSHRVTVGCRLRQTWIPA